MLSLANPVAGPDAIVGEASTAAEGTLRVQKHLYNVAVENKVAFRTRLRESLDEQLREGVGEE